MYEVKAIHHNGTSVAQFRCEDDARHSFARILTQYSSRKDQLSRLELLDDGVLVALFDSISITEDTSRPKLHHISPRRWAENWGLRG